MKKELLVKFREYGYSSQRAIARALVEKGHYQNIQSTTTFLNQVINGYRHAPSKLVDGIVALCNGDPEISTLLNQPSSVSLEGRLELAFDELYLSLKKQFREADKSTKMKMYISFEDYIKKNRQEE